MDHHQHVKEFVEEKVVFIVDPKNPNKFIPRISVCKTTQRGIGRDKVDKTFRPMSHEDIERVLDFDEVPDPPPDGPMRHAELSNSTASSSDPDNNNGSGITTMNFPTRHFCLRGGFLFYFDIADVSGTGQSHYITYHGPPIGVIPLDKVKIDVPPGGRRVFREHSHTDARNGYELVILHQPDKTTDATRPPCFVVAETLSGREKWAQALKARASAHKNQTSTILRAISAYAAEEVGMKPQDLLKQKSEDKQKQKQQQQQSGQQQQQQQQQQSNNNNNNNKQQGQQQQQQRDGDHDTSTTTTEKGDASSRFASTPNKDGGKKSKSYRNKNRSSSSVSSASKQHYNQMKMDDRIMMMLDGGKGKNEDEVIQEALTEFGKNSYAEKAWIDNYFELYSEVDAELKCRQMEYWQEAIKKGLKGAVLEQYEYFVEASGEMTSMGREVIALKTLVETQVETVKEMKEIDFSSFTTVEDDYNDSIKAGGINNNNNSEGIMGAPGGAEFDITNEQPSRKNNRDTRRKKNTKKLDPFAEDNPSDDSSLSSYEGNNNNRKDLKTKMIGSTSSKPKFRDPNKREGAIDVPTWLDDVAEEVLAFVKESRYSDATNLWAKAKHEIDEILLLHEQPIPENLLTKKQYRKVQALKKGLDDVAEITSNRLVEGLRRKNEALKQAAKRERSDPMSHLSPSVSPCCLQDDAVPLRLLVKLGKTQEAATAYAARRSLLLLESLHERPISGTGNVDLVIYAAQLSQSFFSCMATSIEGFMDLFSAGSGPLAATSGTTPASGAGGSGGGTSASGGTATTMTNTATATTTTSNGGGHGYGNGQNGNVKDPILKEDMSFDELSSVNSHSLYFSQKKVPAGALASVVLWCDAELAKFGAAFGGTRVLGNLALSPPPREDPTMAEQQSRKGPRVLGSPNNANGANGVGNGEADATKDRQNAIEVAAQCVGQAFKYAAENLDTVGLPLTPRLAECIRERLKGCEAEVAELLDDEWKATTFDWMYEYAGEDESLHYGYANDTPFDQQQHHHNGTSKRSAVHYHPDVS